MAYGDQFPHTATPRRPTQSGTRVQGEREVKDVPGTPFACFLILPTGGREQPAPRGRRTVTTPTLLLPELDDAGAPVAITAELLIDVSAPEYAPQLGAETVRWQVDGDATPFAKPGELVGSMVTLKRVRD